MSFKVVDGFYGATGEDAFFGIGDDDRDGRRFESVEEAKDAVLADKLDAECRTGKPRADRWNRRFMNLEIVTSPFRWCQAYGDDRWRWQEPIEFEFVGPLVKETFSYKVFLMKKLLGKILMNSDGPARWSARKRNTVAQDGFVSAYQAACFLKNTLQ